MEHVGLLVTERHDAGIDLVADIQEHVDKRHFVGRDVTDQLAVALVFCRISRIDNLRRLIIQSCKLRKLARRQLVGKLIAVERVDVCKPHRIVDLVVAFQFLEKLRLFFIVALRNDERHHVAA